MKKLASRIDLFRELPPGSVGVEVGVWRGYLSSEILSLPNIARLYLVDDWRPYLNENQMANEAEARKNVSGFGYRAHVIKAESKSAAKSFMPISDMAKLLDFAYIDAGHSYDSCKADLIAWGNTLKPTGCLMGHDYTDNAEAKAHGFGVIEAVNDFCAENGWKITALTNEIWASYRLDRHDFTGAEL